MRRSKPSKDRSRSRRLSRPEQLQARALMAADLLSISHATDIPDASAIDVPAEFHNAELSHTCASTPIQQTGAPSPGETGFAITDVLSDETAGGEDMIQVDKERVIPEPLPGPLAGKVIRFEDFINPLIPSAPTMGPGAAKDTDENCGTVVQIDRERVDPEPVPGPLAGVKIVWEDFLPPSFPRTPAMLVAEDGSRANEPTIEREAPAPNDGITINEEAHDDALLIVIDKERVDPEPTPGPLAGKTVRWEDFLPPGFPPPP